MSKSWFRGLVSVAVGLLIAWPANAAEQRTDLANSATAVKTFVYKKIGERELQIHVHFPPGWKTDDRRPAIVFFFGGGWTGGSVAQFEPQANYFAGRGLVTARADYRVKSRDGVTPDKCVEDARSAVRWLRGNAVKLGVDPAKLITSGGSAGGHLAACMMIAGSVNDEGDDLTISTIPQAMILYNPVLNFNHEALLARLGDRRELAAKISPTLHLDKNTPPALILFGTNDRLKVHGDEYWEKAGKLGVRAEKYLAEGQGHGFFNRPPWLQRTTIAADKFLASLGFLEGEPTIEAPSGNPPGRPRAADTRPQRPAADAQRQAREFFAHLDRNHDGKLAREELPEQARRMFDRMDADRDGTVTAEEFAKFRASRPPRGDRPPQRDQPVRPQPDFTDVSYGPHPRNVFDLWQAKSDEPAPLVIYYHGGGFRGGDKRTINPGLLRLLLQHGVSVAAVNYRLTDVAPFPAQMHDCARALQFIRYHAAKYNVDPKRVGATGGSAGAGISMWLAFHDDLADAKSSDPVARQSTRISAAVVYGAQSSYDPRFIGELFDTDHVDSALIPFFGMTGPEDVKDPKFHPLFEEASPINHATADDAPVMLFYPQPNTPLPPNSDGRQHIHHPKFGMVLKQKLDKLGVECVLKFREDHPDGAPVDDYAKFFFEKLGVEKE